MTKLLKKEQPCVIAKLCSLVVPTSKSSISQDLQKVLDNNSKVFDAPKGLPPIRDHDHVINLILGSVPPNIKPYLMGRHFKVKMIMIVLNTFRTKIIFRRTTKMGHKDVGL